MKSEGIIGVGLSSSRKDVKSEDLDDSKKTYLGAEFGG